jgi:5-hydroxyisourate hydrolase-like protein (transthyretin family)
VPNNGSFTLSGTLGNYNGTIDISVTDAADKMILKKTVAIHNGVLQEHIDAGSDLPTGIYFLKITAGDHAAKVMRFVKE